MDKLQLDKLQPVLDEYYEQTKKAAKAILEELKANSKDYGDLRRNYIRFRQHNSFAVGAKEKYNIVFIEIEREIEREINNIGLVKEKK